MRLLDRAGANVEIVAETNVALPDLRNRNLLLLGNPEYSVAPARLLEAAELTVAYDPSRRERVVRSRREARSTRPTRRTGTTRTRWPASSA